MAQRETTHGERIVMIQAKLDGMTLTTIAQRYGLHRDTVRHWWRRYRDQGWDGLLPQPRQRPTQGVLHTFHPLVRYAALRLKCHHPGWGADVILLKLRQHPGLRGQPLPSRSALAAYLSPYLPRIKGRRSVAKRPAQARYRVTQAHEGWQMDFKGAETLGACGSSAPFMLVDVFTSAPLHTQLYPGTLKGVTWRTVQTELRTAFTSWGLPDFIQMDRGSVFVGSSRLEWPSGLLLWLVGLGVMPIVNRPHCPTDNAQVERQNGVWQQRVAWGANFATWTQAQHATDQSRHDQLLRLPSRNRHCQGHPPLIACPELTRPRRAYAQDRERELFDFERVALYLSDWSWRRLVDQTGCISLADHNISVGRAYQGQSVSIVFDLDVQLFIAQAYDEARTVLRRFSLPEVTPEYILGLEDLTLGTGG